MLLFFFQPQKYFFYFTSFNLQMRQCWWVWPKFQPFFKKRKTSLFLFFFYFLLYINSLFSFLLSFAIFDTFLSSFSLVPDFFFYLVLLFFPLKYHLPENFFHHQTRWLKRAWQTVHILFQKKEIYNFFYFFLCYSFIFFFAFLV